MLEDSVAEVEKDDDVESESDDVSDSVADPLPDSVTVLLVVDDTLSDTEREALIV